MQYTTVIFIFSGLYFGLESAVMGNPRRSKRLIGGDTISDKERSAAGLEVLQYYVWIGLAHECYEDAPWWVRYFDWAAVGSPAQPFVEYALTKLCPYEKPENVVCGGALITPQVVQTACHCVALNFHNDKTHWGYFRLRTYLERDLFIYMGRSDVVAFYYPIKSKLFAAHQKCGLLREPPMYSRYDIGWIILDGDVPGSKGVSTNYWGPLDYAGPYKKEELEKFSDRVMAERHVCLVVGYGRAQEVGGSKSSTFKFGWIQILDYTHCFDVLWKSRGYDTLIPYNETGWWVCSHPLYSQFAHNAFAAQHWKADSGSPITCSNNYFALISGLNYFEDEPRAGLSNISRETAIRCSPESNTIEYRRQFDADIQIGRYRFSSVGNFRMLKYPNGSIKFPNLRHHGMVLDVTPAPMKPASLPTSSSGRNIQSLRSVFLSITILLN